MSEDRPPSAPPGTASTRTAEAVARTGLQTGSGPAPLARHIRRGLLGVVSSVIFIPLIFYLRFGIVGPLGWGLTVFLSAVSLLVEVGLYFRARPEYHTPVRLRNVWLDRVGAFWLAACAFGPLFGWVLTSAFVLTEDNWRWLYWGRVILGIGLPVLTALPLLRYVRGPGVPVMIALLVGVTALPIWSAWATLRDLRSGPVNLSTRRASAAGRSAEALYLPHTRKVLEQP